MTDERETLSEAEAARLWQRAAELQADAARRAEARAAGSAEGEVGPELRRPGEGYALVHVRAAALEAGISEEFVEAALAEVRAQSAAVAFGSVPRRPISRWILGNPEPALTARRHVRATPRGILEAMEAVLPQDPYRLTLRERQGDPERGGLLVFDIPGASFSGAAEKGFVGEASFADLRQVLVSLTPRPADPGVTTVTVTAPVAWAWRINASLSALVVGLGSILAFTAGGALGSGLLALGALGTVAVAGTAGGLGTAVGLSGFRALHRYGRTRGERALDGLLAAVAARAEGGWGIAPPKE